MHKAVFVVFFFLSEAASGCCPFSFNDCRNLERGRSISSGKEGFEFVAVIFVINRDFLPAFYFFAKTVSSEAGHVEFENVPFFLIVLHYPVCDLESGVYEFDFVLRTFEHRKTVDLNEFVDIAEAGIRLAGGNCVTHSVAVNRRSLTFKVADA